MQNSEYGRSSSAERSKFLSIEPPPPQSSNSVSNSPSDNINQLIDDYYQSIRQFCLQIKFLGRTQARRSSLLVMSNLAAGPDGRSKPEDPTARNLDFSSLEVGGVLPGVLSVQIPFSPSSPISSSLVVIAPPSDVVASQEALVDCELSNSAVMDVESGVNLDIEDPEFIQSLTSRSEPIITEPNRSAFVSHMAPHSAAQISVPSVAGSPSVRSPTHWFHPVVVYPAVGGLFFWACHHIPISIDILGLHRYLLPWVAL
eukprot:gene33762-43632_t